MAVNQIVFERKAYAKLLKWKKESRGDSAMLIQGARRIGKSTLAVQFARNEYKSFILVDFSSAPPAVFDLFKDLSNINYIFFQLQLIYHVTLYERQSVIIFDEVQLCPLARQAIKHLVADHRYDYIETGSLVSVRKKSEEIIIPSEEVRIDMFPMDYEEFRWALGDKTTIPLLRSAFQARQSLGDKTHRQMMRDFRLYMLVGGMPQAVLKYIQTNNLAAVDDAKRKILSLYAEDLRKLDPVADRASALFNSIPGQLSKNVSRYHVSSSLAGDRPERLSNIILALEDTMVTNIAYHADDPNVGLALSKDVERFKMFVADTGLFVTLAFKDKDVTENDVYNRLLADKLSTNLGYVYENVIAQMLCASGKKLFYHTLPHNDRKKSYEIDFLFADGHKISPVEVKSSGYKAHASLDVFCEKFSDRIQNKYVVYTKDFQRIGDVDYVPVYMTMFL